MDDHEEDGTLAGQGLSRRTFVGGMAAAVGFVIVPRRVLGGPGYQAPSDTLHIATVGVGGQGASNTAACAKENIVALCDVDDNLAASVYKTYPNAATYRDFRVMLEKQKDIDAVIVATPDHTHAVIAMAAMNAAWRSRWTICVEIGSRCRPRAASTSSSRSGSRWL